MKKNNSCKIEPVSTDLIKLKRIIESPAFGTAVAPIRSAPSVIQCKMDYGSSTMIGLIKTEKIGIAWHIVEPNSRFPTHHHKIWESLTVFKGSMVLYDGNDKTLKNLKPPPDCPVYYIQPDEPHYGICNEYTEFVAMCMPVDESWPEGVY